MSSVFSGGNCCPFFLLILFSHTFSHCTFTFFTVSWDGAALVKLALMLLPTKLDRIGNAMIKR